MKKTLIAIALLLSGCGRHVTLSLIEKAQSVCVNNGGVSFIATNAIGDKLPVYCANGAQFWVEAE